MRITDISVVLHDRRTDVLKVFAVRDGRLPMGVLRIRTDEGVEGNSFLSSPGPGAEAVAEQIVRFIKPLLLGEDPLDIGMHWARMHAGERYVDPIGDRRRRRRALGHRRQGRRPAGPPAARHCPAPSPRATSRPGSPRARRTTRRRRSTGASRGGRATSCIRRRAPWDAAPARPIEADIDGVPRGPRGGRRRDGAHARRELGLLRYAEALTVGRAIEELGLRLVRGSAAGRRHLRLYASSSSTSTSRSWPPRSRPVGSARCRQWITARATDMLRGDVVIKGGITGMMKIAPPRRGVPHELRGPRRRTTR